MNNEKSNVTLNCNTNLTAHTLNNLFRINLKIYIKIMNF